MKKGAFSTEVIWVTVVFLALAIVHQRFVEVCTSVAANTKVGGGEVTNSYRATYIPSIFKIRNQYFIILCFQCLEWVDTDS